MSNRKGVVIGSLVFATKSEGKAYFKRMLNSYRPGDTVSTSDGVHLHALLQMHQDAARKIGPGVVAFGVRRADFGTQCFEAIRVDGTREKFTYIGCVTQNWT